MNLTETVPMLYLASCTQCPIPVMSLLLTLGHLNSQHTCFTD